MPRKASASSPRDHDMWSPIGKATYEIRGRRYIFEIRRPENGAHFAWCKTVKKWAWLYSDRVLFENDGMFLAKCIKFELEK